MMLIWVGRLWNEQSTCKVETWTSVWQILWFLCSLGVGFHRFLQTCCQSCISALLFIFLLYSCFYIFNVFVTLFIVLLPCTSFCIDYSYICLFLMNHQYSLTLSIYVESVHHVLCTRTEYLYSIHTNNMKVNLSKYVIPYLYRTMQFYISK